MVLIPKYKDLVARNKIIVPFGVRGQGYYKIEAINAGDGRKRLLADWFPNLITDNGLNKIATTDNWGSYCRVGSGSTAPANGDTALVSHVAQTSTIVSSSASTGTSTPPYYGYDQNVWRFATGVAAGNLSEVGIGDSVASGNGLFSRALILDGLLDPTTITVLSNEILDVTYQFRVYVPTDDAVGTVDISGTTYDTIIRPARVTTTSFGLGNVTTTSKISPQTQADRWNAYDGDLGSVTASTPSGNGQSMTGTGSTVTVASYSNNSHELGFTIFASITSFNPTLGIRSIIMQGGANAGSWQIQFNNDSDSTRIPKDSNKTLELDFLLSWDRAA